MDSTVSPKAHWRDYLELCKPSVVALMMLTAVIGMFLLVMRLPPAADVRRPRWIACLVCLARPFAPRHFLATCWSMRPLTALAAALVVALTGWLSRRTARRGAA